MHWIKRTNKILRQRGQSRIKWLKRPYFNKIFICFTMVIVLLQVTLFCAFELKQRKVELELAVQADIEKMNHIAAQVDAQFQKIHDMIISLMNREWVIRMSSNSEVMLSYFDTSHNRDIYQELGSYNRWIGFSKTAAVIDTESGRCINPYCWQSFDFLCRNVGLTDTESQEQLLKLIEESGNVLKLLDLKDYLPESNDMGIIVEKIPTSAYSTCYFLAFFERKSMDAFLAGMSSELFQFQILDAGGSCMWDYQKEMPESAVHTTVNSGLGWSYTLSYGESLKQSSKISVIGSGLMLIGAFGTAMVIAYLFASILYRPVLQLMKNLGVDVEGKHSEYDQIQTYVLQNVQRRMQVEQESERYYAVVRNSVLQKVIHGYFNNTDYAWESECETYQIPMKEESWYQVIRIELLQRKTKHLSVQDEAKSWLTENKKRFELVEDWDGELLLLLFCENEEKRMQEEELTLLKEHISAMTSCELQIVDGICAKGIIGISKSYGSMQLINENTSVFYPTDWEVQLITQLKYGNVEIVNRILNELDMENHMKQSDREIQLKAAKIIFETMVRVMSELDMFQRELLLEYHHNLNSRDADAEWKLLYQMSEEICQKAHSKYSKEEPSELFSRVRAFVDEHYMSKDMSLKLLSMEFKVSESTISRLFKEQQQGAFADYICVLRMEKAKEYLLTQKYTVKAIADMVGYQSDISFSRAFLKYEGIRPSGYAEYAKKQKERS